MCYNWIIAKLKDYLTAMFDIVSIFGSIFIRHAIGLILSFSFLYPDSRATIFKCTRVITLRMSDTVHPFTLEIRCRQREETKRG